MKKIRITLTLTEEQANWLWQTLEGLLQGWESEDPQYKFFDRIRKVILRRME